MRGVAVCGVGGGIFAKTAKTPPLQSAIAGILIAMRHYNNHDAARHVATIFERWNCLIETYLPVRRGSYKRLMNLSVPFAAVSLLEYGGLNPILPILGGRSDAARRVVILLHGSHLWGPYGFSNDAARRVVTWPSRRAG